MMRKGVGMQWGVQCDRRPAAQSRFQPSEKFTHTWPARLRLLGRERRAQGAQLFGPGRRGGAQATRQREEGRRCRLPRHALYRCRAARGACWPPGALSSVDTC